MANFSNIDVEKIVVAWEEEEDLWDISGGGGGNLYSYLDLPFSALLVRYDVIQTFLRFIQGLVHRRMGHGFRFLLPPFLLTTPPPIFFKFLYKSFLFQNFHDHSFFLHLTISVDVIHHE